MSEEFMIINIEIYQCNSDMDQSKQTLKQILTGVYYTVIINLGDNVWIFSNKSKGRSRKTQR